MKQELVQTIIRLRTENLLSLSAIANKLALGRETIARLLRKHGINTSSKLLGVDQRREAIISAYKDGRSLLNISQEFDCSRETISRIIKEAGLEIRNIAVYQTMDLNEDEVCRLRDGGKRRIIDIAKIMKCSVGPIKRILQKHGLGDLYSRSINVPDEQIIAEYKSGVSAQKIGDKIGCSSNYVLKVLNRNRVPKYKPGHFGSIDLPVKEICDLYQTTSHTMDTLASKYKCAQRTIYRLLRDNGIKTKKYQKSVAEIEIYTWVKEMAPDAEHSNRVILDGKELDIYIPSKNLAIELDGAYWHSVKYLSPTASLKKTKMCQEKGIKLIHIWDFEWIEKREIVQSRLLSILGKTEVIYARKCEVREVISEESAAFLEKSHIQGNVYASKRLGLYYQNELVSLMTFGKARMNNDLKHELLRFCNKLNTTVVGAASKLFKHSNLTDVVSYADLRWSTGNLYEKLGFKHLRNSRPNYFYVCGRKRLSRQQCMKHKLVEDGASKKKTEIEIMKERHFERVYDCGNGVWIYTSKTKEARLLAEGFNG